MKKIIRNIILLLKKRDISRKCKIKWANMIKNIQLIEIPSNVLDEYRKKFLRLGCSSDISFLNIVASTSGIVSGDYVPEDIQYGLIEPILNNRSFCLSFNDKNLYHRYLGQYSKMLPKTILRSIDYHVYDENYTSLKDSEIISVFENLDEGVTFIAKPTIETGGGENVVSFKKIGSKILFLEKELFYNDFLYDLSLRFKGSFILQHKIKQHIYFSVFNESSVNTVRMYVYRSVVDNKVHPLHAYIRYGAKGSLVDSSSQGGFTCGINISTGCINPFSVSKEGKKIYHDIAPLNNLDKNVPCFSQMKDLAKEIAYLFPYHHLLGFDFCVDENANVRLFEVNNLYVGVINQQMSTGPLYREFTDEIIDYCLNNKNKRSFVFKI